MRRTTFGPGTPVLLRGKPYELIAPDVLEGREIWHVERLELGERVKETKLVSELDELYDQGLLLERRSGTLHPTPAEKRRDDRRAVPLSDLPEDENKRVAFRKAVIRAIEERLPPGLRYVQIRENGNLVYEQYEKDGVMVTATTPETVISRELMRLGDEFGRRIYGRPIAVRPTAYAKWRNELAEHQNDLAGNLAGRGNRNQLAPEVKRAISDVIAVQLRRAQLASPDHGTPIVSMKQIVRLSKPGIEAIAAARPDIANVRVPSPPVFYSIYNSFPAYLREINEHGRTKARSLQRSPGLGENEPRYALEILQYDETRLPFFCIHERLGIPIGRPYLALLIDEYSGAIIGFYLGFSPGSAAVLASVLRHGASKKGYVATRYPSISRRWIYSGLGKLLLVDNSLAAHSNSMNEIGGNLDLPVRFTPARMPWVKGEVEGSFTAANRLLLSKLKGFTLNVGDGWAKNDYDPAQNAVIGYYQLLLIIHHWILDYYHVRTTPDMPVSPHDRWLDGTAEREPEFLDNGLDLDLVFGVKRPARMDHRGVRYLNLYYWSDEIKELRKIHGSETDVEVKLNPNNMTKIYVRVPGSRDLRWKPAHARELDYARMVDEHVHSLYEGYAKRHFGRAGEVEDFLEAQSAMVDLMGSAPAEAFSMRTLGYAARAAGLDTARIFSDMDHDGNPPAETPAASQATRALAPPPAAPAGAVTPAPAQRRAIPVFDADNSLRR